VDPDVLESMSALLAHRGPDDAGTFVDGHVGLAHRRLSILDLTTGHQPMTADGVTVVFNGEIYNYVELRDDLARLGHRFQTTSDTEVLLRAYLQFGEDCVRQFNGMFAFLVYDPARHRLLAARDHFGIKPLYWHAEAGRLLFASEIKAFLRYPGFEPVPDPDAIADYLTFQYVLHDRTLFRGVRKLLPGQYTVVDTRTLDTQAVRYWEPRFHVDRNHTEHYFTEELDRLLHDAVRIQVRSDVPVGSYLSGGMDSSLVTLLAAPLCPAPYRTFTGAFREGPQFDESAYAREVAGAAGAESHVIHPTEDDFVDVMPVLAWHMDEPAAGPGLFPQYMVSRLARQKVTVALGGQGGDEIFGGYARYVVAYLEQAIKGAIQETTEEGEHIVSLHTILPNLPYLKQYVPMMKEFWRDGAFEDMDRRYFRLVDRGSGDREPFTPDVRAALGRTDAFERFRQVFNHPDTQSYFNRMTHFDMVAGLPSLLHVEDRVSMAVSLESRVPLLDRRIADLVASMPPAMKFKGAEMKYVLRKVVANVLPRRILERKDKMGFPVPLHLWARGGRCRDFFRDVLLSERCRGRGLFDCTALERMMSTEAAFGRRLWGLLNLELWFATFVDGDAA
jgi:asparagine synthase (glutamine-hydrolysing)